MRSPTLDANVQFMQEASQMKNSKHVKLKTFFDPCQTHLLYMISLNLSPLSTLCTLQTITYKKSIFYFPRIFRLFVICKVESCFLFLHNYLEILIFSIATFLLRVSQVSNDTMQSNMNEQINYNFSIFF